MTDPGLDELFILNRKLDELLKRYDNLRRECSESKAETADLKSKLHDRDERIKDLENKYERLKISGALLGGVEGAVDAKRKITELVREIDKCVALLNR